MKTQRTNVLKVTVALVSLVVFFSTSTIRAQDNHYKPDFIRQMVYQLSNEVIDHSGLVKLALKQSETRPNAELLINWNIPVSHAAYSSRADESERVSLEEFLLKAARPYQAAAYLDCKIGQEEQPAGVGSELEEMLIRAARPYYPGYFCEEVPYSYDALEVSLLEAAKLVKYYPQKIEE